MKYAFDLVGVSPMVEFFHQEQSLAADKDILRPAYFGVTGCSLDLFLASMEEAIQERNWDLDEAVDSVVQYWVKNKETVEHWRDRLQVAGNYNLLVGRVADSATLQAEFEVMLGKRFER
jgi:hypothetical protein